MLQVVEAASKFAQDMSSGQIIIESDITSHFATAIEELKSTEARNLATGYAASKGCPDPRINGMVPEPYPINSEGYALDEVRDEKSGEALPPQHPRMQVARYRTVVPVCRKLI